MATAARTVRLTHASPKGKHLTFNLIDTDLESGGVGGWDLIDRKKKQQGTHWTGTPAAVYTLPLRLDGFDTDGSSDTSVDAACRTLMAWGRSSVTKGVTSHPPVLTATGNVTTAASRKWVITNLTWGEKVRNDRGTRVQQDVTIELTEYIAVSAAELKAANGSKSPAAKVKKKVVAKTAAEKVKQPSATDITNHKVY